MNKHLSTKNQLLELQFKKSVKNLATIFCKAPTQLGRVGVSTEMSIVPHSTEPKGVELVTDDTAKPVHPGKMYDGDTGTDGHGDMLTVLILPLSVMALSSLNFSLATSYVNLVPFSALFTQLHWVISPSTMA